jgi:hypothetical protein
MNPQIFIQKSWSYLKKKMGDSPDEYAFTKGQIVSFLEQAAFKSIHVEPYEFLHPSTYVGIIPLMFKVEGFVGANIEPVQSAVGDKDGVVTFLENENHHADHKVLKKSLRDPPEGEIKELRGACGEIRFFLQVKMELD